MKINQTRKKDIARQSGRTEEKENNRKMEAKIRSKEKNQQQQNINNNSRILRTRNRH